MDKLIGLMIERRFISGFSLLLLISFFGGCTSRLHRAIDRGDGEKVKVLLEHGGKPNNYVYWYGVPITSAVFRCDFEIIRLLLDYGAHIDDTAAELSLRTGVRNCEYSVVELLLKRDFDPNANHYLGGTILMEGIERGDLSIVKLLLNYGADPNLKGKYEEWVKPKPGETTPLMLASKIGRSDLVNVLLERNADPTVIDVFGYTAIKIAREMGNHQIVEIIEENSK